MKDSISVKHDFFVNKCDQFKKYSKYEKFIQLIEILWDE